MSKLHPMLQPYVPTVEDPFDADKAAHLLSRAGFGGTPAEIEKVQKMGPQDAADWLFDFPDATAEEQSQSDVPNLSSIDGLPKDFRTYQKQLVGKTEEERKMLRQQFQRANREAILATIDWWMKRMAYGPYPLQEKLTLFWHGHFTTSAKDERSATLMWAQNELLRRQAAGNFGSFVKAISRDPAMLDYLNNNENRKAHPNENYARELMELFTLGIGNYTEDDIKQGARAFTGWGHDGDDFVFRRAQHDDDTKTFFGRTGNFNGDDIVEMILQHHACAPYIATKLYNYFVCDYADPDLSASLGELLKDNHYELRPLLRTMFTSQAFYSSGVMGSEIKSPIQLVVGTVRMLGLEMPSQRGLMGPLTQMGQTPFGPPNVKGWPGGRQWINTSTLFVRYNTAVYLAGGTAGLVPHGNAFAAAKGRFRMEQPPAMKFNPETAQTPEAVADKWVARLIQRPLDAPKKQVLLDALAGKPQNEDAVRRMVQLIVSMPEYQLC